MHGYLISGSYDTTIKIWDLKNFECIKTLENVNMIILLENYNLNREMEKIECLKTTTNHINIRQEIIPKDDTIHDFKIAQSRYI